MFVLPLKFLNIYWTEVCYHTAIPCSYVFLTFAFVVIYINLCTYPVLHCR